MTTASSAHASSGWSNARMARGVAKNRARIPSDNVKYRSAQAFNIRAQATNRPVGFAKARPFNLIVNEGWHGKTLLRAERLNGIHRGRPSRRQITGQ